MGGADSGAKRAAKRAAKPHGVTNFAVSRIRREGGGRSPRSQATRSQAKPTRGGAVALPRWCALNMPHMLRRQPGWFLSSYSPVKGDERPVLAEMACAASGEAASVPAAASCERKARRPWGAPICKADELPTARTQTRRASMSETRREREKSETRGYSGPRAIYFVSSLGFCLQREAVACKHMNMQTCTRVATRHSGTHADSTHTQRGDC